MTTKSARRIRYRGHLWLGPVLLDEFSSHKIIRVLRLGAGATISVVDDVGTEAICRIVSIDGQGVTVHPVPEEISSSSKMDADLIPATIAIALIKNERMDEAIEKACEFGIANIQPFVADHSSRRFTSADRIERWRRIASSAALQSGGRRETAILSPQSGIVALLANRRAACSPATAMSHSEILFFHPAGEPVGKLLSKPDESVVAPGMILVGPEGGWSENELSYLADQSARAISLGNRILRTETAVTIAAFLAFQFNKITP